MPKPIERISLQSEIIRYIQDYIRDNELTWGHKLPSQGQFIEMMQVSRTALREAVKTLEAENIIEVRNGKGLFVGDQAQGQSAISSVLGFTLEKEKLLETLEARRAMEKEVLEMVIRKATEKELEELGKIEKVLMEKFYAGVQQTREDKEFHHMIYRLCHNTIMYALITLLDEYTDKLWEFPLQMEDPFLESMPYHAELYQAICDRNVAKAQKINNKLLDCVYLDIVKQLKK